MSIKLDGLGSALAPRGPHILTPFERRILELLASGMTRAEIASALRVSPESVSHSLTNAKEKMGARTPTEAVVVFVREGSISHR
jgi:two-component system response regulator DesR